MLGNKGSSYTYPHTYVLYYINYHYTHTLFIMLWQMAKVIQHALVVHATT